MNCDFHGWKIKTEMVSLLGAVFCSMLFVQTNGLANEIESWQPSHSRVFLVSLTRFKSDRLRSFSTDDRLDDALERQFRDRSVPTSQIVLLKDEAATTENIQKQFTQFLRQSHPTETLIFYFGSHGSYDHKTGDYSFCAFDHNLSFHWVLEAIERDFRGTKAIIFTDCCYSGGIVELTSKRNTKISYACLSSTAAHQTASSGWRFVRCLLRGLAGDAVVDLDGNGQIDLEEMALYTARYMAFVAEGKPLFHVTGDFPSKLRIATTTGTKSHRAGEFVLFDSQCGSNKAEILETRDQKVKLHFTKDARSVNDAWFSNDRVHPFRFECFPKGMSVELMDSDDVWHAGKVLDNWESMHLGQYQDQTNVDDEWFGPSRIRRSIVGKWAGQWENTHDQKGAESLELFQSKNEKLSGTWSGNLKLTGERIGPDTIYFEARNPTRFYRCTGRIEGTHMILNYIAHRTNDGGHYHGWAKLGQHGESVDVTRDQRAEFNGNWRGTYENSKGGQGQETLELAETQDRLHGTWSGVGVTGERLGDATFFLEGTSGQRHYHIMGRVSKDGGLVLDYFAFTGSDHYSGRSWLNH